MTIHTRNDQAQRKIPHGYSRRQTQRLEVRNVPCVGCGAQIGEPCMNATKEHMVTTHATRRRMATRAANARITHDPAGYAAGLTPTQRKDIRTRNGFTQADVGKFLGMAGGNFRLMEKDGRGLADPRFALYGAWLLFWADQGKENSK